MLIEPVTDVAVATGRELELVCTVGRAFAACAIDTAPGSIDADAAASAE
jgi:hypothetical protein